MYKLSKYNFFIPSEKKDITLYNSYSMNVFKLTHEDYQKLLQFDESLYSLENINFLLKNSIIIEENNKENNLIINEMNLTRKNKIDQNFEISVVRLSLTENCNMACSYCFQAKLFPDAKPTLENTKMLDTLQWLVSQPDLNFLTIQYFGGEPLLKFDLIQKANSYLIEAKNNKKISGFRQSITTNGTLLNEKRLKYFKKNNFDLIFSLDGWEELNDKNRVYKNGKGSYNRVKKNMDLYKSIFGDVSVLFTPTNNNLHLVPEIIDHFIFELKVDSIGFNSPQPTKNGWEVDGEKLANVIYNTWKTCDENGILFHGPGTFIPNYLKNKIINIDRCVDANTGSNNKILSLPIYISAENEISSCLVHQGEESNLGSDLNNVNYDCNFKKWHLDENNHSICDSCIASRLCGGPCGLEKAFNSDNLNNDRCSFYKTLINNIFNNNE